MAVSQQIREKILERLSQGETLRGICKTPDFPTASAVVLWCDDPEFAKRYARARSLGLEVMAEEIIEISDESGGDIQKLDMGDGVEVERVDHENIQRSKLRVDTRKWLLSRLKPEKYGDKLATTLSAPDGGPVKIETSGAKSELAAILDGIASRAAEGTVPRKPE